MTKPKILLAKYLDWAVLAVLALVLIFAVVKSFVLTDTSLTQLSTDLEQADQKVKKAMKSETVPPAQPQDLLGELRTRFEHPPVLNPYLRDPFVTFEDIPYPGGAIQLYKDQVYSVKLRGTRLKELIPSEQSCVKVELSYDLEAGTSTVKFTALAVGSADIRIRADDERVHLFAVSVRKVPILPNPHPPLVVALTLGAPVEVRRHKEPAKVLIAVTPDNYQAPSPTVGLTTNADIYRKSAGASDAEYIRLNSEPLLPLNRDKIHDIWTRFQSAEQAGREPGAAAPVAPTRGPIVPDTVPVITAPTGGPETVGVEPAAGSFVYLDQEVDEGESYVYKVVTLSAAPGAQTSKCDDPYVSAPQVIGSLVEFIVARISTESAVLTLSRHDPDTGELLHKDFNVRVGMKIGGMLDIGVNGRHNMVDFSTNCVLVNTITSFRTIEYSKLRMDRLFKVLYPVRFLTRDPQILYLTQRGSLHLKSKTQSW